MQSEAAAPFSGFGGYVKNLELKDVVMESTEKYAAGLTLSLTGAGAIENCRVSGSVTCAGGTYAVLADTDSALFNVWSREGSVILPEGHDGQIKSERSTPEAEFSNGTVLDALNNAVEQLNSGSYVPLPVSGCLFYALAWRYAAQAHFEITLTYPAIVQVSVGNRISDND